MKPITVEWPETVWVLTSEFNISGGPGCDRNNNPQNLFGWMQAEFRPLNCSLTRLHLMIDLWMNEFHRIYPTYTRLRSSKEPGKRFNTYDLYNATWASLGYTENQSPRALRLLDIVDQLNPRTSPSLK